MNISYEEYIKETVQKVNTTDYTVPDSAIITQPGDKIVDFIKSQFASQVPYYNMGIRSVNNDLAAYKHTKEF